MNWYKTAKLLNKADEVEESLRGPMQQLFTGCMFCNRFRTDENPEWKTLKKLDDAKDREDAQKAIDMMPYNPKNIGISHGICNYCNKIIEEEGWPKDLEGMKARSLALTGDEDELV